MKAGVGVGMGNWLTECYWGLGNDLVGDSRPSWAPAATSSFSNTSHFKNYFHKHPENSELPFRL